MIIKNSLWSVLLTFMQLIFAFIMVPLYIKYLGNLEYGVLILSTVIIGFSSIFSFGLGETTLRYVSKFYASGNIVKIKSLLETVWFIYIIIAILLFILLFFYPEILSFLLKDFNNLNIFKLVAILVFLNFFGGIFNIIPEALQNYKFIAQINIINIFILNIGIFYLLKTMPNVSYILIWQILCNILMISINFIFFYNKFKLILIPKIHISLLKDIFSYSFFTFLIHLVVYLRLHFETFLISFLLGVKNIVYLDTPRNVVSKSAVIIRSIERVFFPKFSEISEDINKSKSLLIKSMIILTIISVSIFIPLTLFFFDFISLWINEDFAKKSYFIGVVISSSFLLSGVVGISIIFLKSINKVKLLSFLELINSIVSIILTYALVRNFGLYGVGFSFWIARLINSYTVFYVFYFIFDKDKNNLIKMLFFLLFNYLLLILLFFFKLNINLVCSDFFSLILNIIDIILLILLLNIFIVRFLWKINLIKIIKRKLYGK